MEDNQVQQPESEQVTQPQQVQTIGQKIQAARKIKNIDISSVATDTRIKISFLEAIENDDFAVLPNLVTARGFMKVYADYLGLNVQEFVDQFNQKFPDQVVGANTPRNPNEMRIGLEVDKREFFPASMKTMNSSNGSFTKGSSHGTIKPKQIGLIVLGIIIFLTLLNLYFKVSMESITNAPRQSSDMVTLDAKATPETLPQASENSKAFITLEALNKTYLQVIIDGRMFFRGNVNKGDVKTWQGDQYIKIKAEVPRNIHLFVNGRDEGMMADQMTMLEKTYFPGAQAPSVSATVTPEVKEAHKYVAPVATQAVKVETASANETTKGVTPPVTTTKDEGVYGF